MLNLTDMRKRALRIIQQRPEITAQDLGYELVERAWKHPAAATRWGAGYVRPLIDAGLVTADVGDTPCGWARLALTAAGRAALAGAN